MQAWTSSSTCGLAKITGRSFYPQFYFTFGFSFWYARAFACLASRLRLLEIFAQQCFALSLGMV